MMASYINFTPDVFGIQHPHGIKVWQFPEEFSQSRLGDRLVGSNACTLIAVLLAGRIDDYRIKLWGYIDQPLSRMLVTSLAEAIIDGNEIHEHLRSTHQLPYLNVNVPEALDAIRDKFPFLIEWSAKSMTVLTPLGESFADRIEPPLFDWTNHPPQDKKEGSDLYILLIADERTVLFIYQPQLDKISMVDSHTHMESHSGALVAQAHVGDLEHLCGWFCQMCHNSFGRGEAIMPYELSFLYSIDPYM